MHRVEDLFVHCIYFKTHAVPESGHSVNKLRKALVKLRDINKHYHSEHILKYALGHFGNVSIEFSADTADLCKNTDCILTNNSYNSYITTFSAKID